MANRNFSNGGKIFQMETMPVQISMSFQTAIADTSGTGITAGSLVGPTVAAVYMVTNQTKAAGSPGSTTGPAAGTIVIDLQDNYNQLLGVRWSAVAPNSGSSLLVASAGLTAGVAYTITILGTTTTAHWHDLGVPAGITPSVGVSFIAAATSTTGTGAVQISLAAGSGIFSIEGIGSPNLLVAPNPTQQSTGTRVILQCRKDSAGDAPTIAAPSDLTTLRIELLMSNSSVKIQGS